MPVAQGGVIMYVVPAEQAGIVWKAGAVAVTALERVPANIGSQGNVTRMSDTDLIDSIIAGVPIPAMAMARIGHLGEARVFEVLGVEYRYFEVLSAADYINHIAKWNFNLPFVCDAPIHQLG